MRFHETIGESPVRTAKANSKLKKNPEIQKFRDFFRINECDVQCICL